MSGQDFSVTNGATVGDLVGHKSPALRVYSKPGLEVLVEGEDTKFVGLIYAPGTPSQTGSVEITSHGRVFGAIVGSGPTTLQSGGSIHFDEQLRSTEPVAGMRDIPRLTYLHISVNQVNVTAA